ncbi:MAG: Long-chain-fatty-acid--CoA ligase, partial [uncultured Ramlibacter sp.]
RRFAQERQRQGHVAQPAGSGAAL